MTKQQNNGKTPVSTFYDLDGQQVSDIKQIAVAYRAMVADEFSDKANKLSDTEVTALVKSVPGDGRDGDIQLARMTKLEEFEPKGSEGTDIPPALLPAEINKLSAVPRARQLAYKYGDMFDAQATKALVVAADAGEDFTGAPIIIEAALQRIFGAIRDAKGKLIRESVMDTWPIPGTGTKKWLENNPDWQKKSNRQLDHYNVVADDGTKISGTFYGDTVDRTSAGKDIALAQAQLKAIKDNEPVLAGTPKRFEALKGDAEGMTSEIGRWTTRRTNMVRKLHLAWQFARQKQEMEDHLSKVGWRFANHDPEKNEEFTTEQLNIASTLKKPIVMFFKGGGKNTPPLSLAAFVRYNAAIAAQKGGTLAAFLETGKREPKPKAAVTATGAMLVDAQGKDIGIPNTMQATAMFSVLNHAFDKSDFLGALYSIANRGGSDKIDLLKNTSLLSSHLDAFCTKYEKQLAAIQQEEREANEAIAAAKLANK